MLKKVAISRMQDLKPDVKQTLADGRDRGGTGKQTLVFNEEVHYGELNE